MSDTKTVLETKEKHPQQQEQEAESKTFTDWRLLEKAGFVPAQIKCEGYKGSHPSDLSCHSNLIPVAGNVVSHMNPKHGGGWFHVKFRLTDGKKSPFWRELEDAGVELQELWCPHCREHVPLQPRRMMQHINANHLGATRVNMHPQTLCMSLSFRRPEEGEFEGLYE